MLWMSAPSLIGGPATAERAAKEKARTTVAKEIMEKAVMAKEITQKADMAVKPKETEKVAKEKAKLASYVGVKVISKRIAGIATPSSQVDESIKYRT